jgi:hypothetical protein
MATRLTSVVIDSADPSTLARWWAAALGWQVGYESPLESDVTPLDGEPGIELTFVPVADKKLVQNRVHLDLRSTTLAEQDETIQRLMASGATEADLGQGSDVPWAVLVDPEGNEFCVLEPRPEYARTGPLAAVVVAALDPAALARFWVEASSRRLSAGAEQNGVHSLPPADGIGPWLEFITTREPHTVKNRLHLDVAPQLHDDQTAEVSRLMNLGALRVEVGQSEAAEGELTWVVLADPEDNEFCVLSSRA